MMRIRLPEVLGEQARWVTYTVIVRDFSLECKQDGGIFDRMNRMSRAAIFVLFILSKPVLGQGSRMSLTFGAD